MVVDSINYTGGVNTNFQNVLPQTKNVYTGSKLKNQPEKDEFSTAAKAIGTTTGILATGYLLTHGHANKWFEAEGGIKKAIDKPAKWLSENIAVPIKEKLGVNLTETEIVDAGVKTLKKIDKLGQKFEASELKVQNLYNEATPETQKLLSDIRDMHTSNSIIDKSIAGAKENVANKQNALVNLPKDADATVKDAASQELKQAADELLLVQEQKIQLENLLKDSHSKLKAENPDLYKANNESLKLFNEIEKLSTRKENLEAKLTKLQNA